MPDLEYKIVMTEPLVVVLPSDHRLASRKAIAIQDIAKEAFLGMSNHGPFAAGHHRQLSEAFGVAIHAEHEIDNLGMAMSLVASTRGVTLLPAYARNFLPVSVISRPLEGEAPTIDLVIGYNKANTSQILKLFLSRSDDLISRSRIRCYSSECVGITDSATWNWPSATFAGLRPTGATA